MINGHGLAVDTKQMNAYVDVEILKQQSIHCMYACISQTEEPTK